MTTIQEKVLEIIKKHYEYASFQHEHKDGKCPICCNRSEFVLIERELLHHPKLDDPRVDLDIILKETISLTEKLVREECEGEIQFKEDRISDLIVERDTGKWRENVIESELQKVKTAIDEFFELHNEICPTTTFEDDVEKLKERLGLE